MTNQEDKTGNLPATPKEARLVGAKHYFTGKPCKNGHVSKRNVTYNKCLDCDRDRHLESRADPKKNAIINMQRRELRKQNPEKYEKSLAVRKLKYAESDEIRDRVYFTSWEKKGVNRDVYEQMMKRQKGLCAICQKKETVKRNNRTLRLAVDHCHDSGRIRGLLCNRCNAGIERARDDIKTLKSAIKYLKKYETRIFTGSKK